MQHFEELEKINIYFIMMNVDDRKCIHIIKELEIEYELGFH